MFAKGYKYGRLTASLLSNFIELSVSRKVCLPGDSGIVILQHRCIGISQHCLFSERSVCQGIVGYSSYSIAA
jgi:hypothetical protein